MTKACATKSHVFILFNTRKMMHFKKNIVERRKYAIISITIRIRRSTLLWMQLHIVTLKFL